MIFFKDPENVFIFSLLTLLFILAILIMVISILKLDTEINKVYEEIENEISNNKRVVDSFRKVKENSNETYNKSQIE